MAAAVYTFEWVGAFSALGPSAPTIQGVLDRVAPEGRGQWIGPARITRTSHLTEASRTRVTAVYVWGSGPPWSERPPVFFSQPIPAPSASLREAIQRELPVIPLGVWGPVTLSRYLPERNGPLDSWASGELANTRTRDVLAPLAGVALPDENPDGPTTPGTTPPAAIPRAGAAAGEALSEAAPYVVGALALYLLLRSRSRR